MKTNVLAIEATNQSVVNVPTEIDVLFSTESSSAANDSTYVLSDSKSKTNLSVVSTHTSSKDAQELLKYREYLSELVNQRKSYDVKLKSHDENLYEILAKCLELSLDPQRNDEKSALRRAIDEQRKSAGATRKIQSNTKFEHVVVRYVFAESCADSTDSPTRAQVSSYAIVLSRAIKEKVNQHDFISWVKKYGGIDKIRRATNSIDEETTETIAVSNKKIILVGKCIDKGVAIGSEITIVGRYEGGGRMSVVTCEVSG